MSGPKHFDLLGVNESETKLLSFAYFLGVMVGDNGKRANYPREPRTMTVLLQLSKHYDSNLRLGNFVRTALACWGYQ